MSEAIRILQVEDSESDAALILRRLHKSGFTIESKRVEEADAMKAALSTEAWDLIIADYQLPQFNAADALEIRNSFARDIPFIIVSGTIGEETAVEMMRAGAQDYILKHRLARLAPAVQREIQTLRSRRNLRLEYQRLAEQLDVREQEVADKTLQSERSNRDNVILLQELHHRVRNNLQTISSLLSMQIDLMNGDDRAVVPLHRANHRVLAIALVHEHLFESTISESALNFSQYAQTLAIRLYKAYSIDPSRVRFIVDIEGFPLSADDAVACGLILNELLANSLKHAFPNDRQGIIQCHLKKISHSCAEFSLVDDGIGLPPNLEHQMSSSLGLKLARALVTQLGGDLQVNRSPGTSFTFAWDLGE